MINNGPSVVTRFAGVICVSFAMGLFVFLASAKAKDGVEHEAVRSSDAWLHLIDEGKFAESWDASAAYFKSAVERDQWVDQLRVVREPLGKVLERRVISVQHYSELPGAPDGEYIVIQYETIFEHKKSSVETVTPMQDVDGRWRVSGYYIK